MTKITTKQLYRVVNRKTENEVRVEAEYEWEAALLGCAALGMPSFGRKPNNAVRNGNSGSLWVVYGRAPGEDADHNLGNVYVYPV